MKVAIAPAVGDYPNAQANQGGGWPDGVLAEGRGGWVVDRVRGRQIQIGKDRWNTKLPADEARYGVVDVPDVDPAYSVTGYDVDYATPSITPITALIDPTDALPVVTNAQIAANINGVVDDLLAAWALRDARAAWDAENEARLQFIADLTAIVKPALAAAGRRIGNKGPDVIAAAEARLTALSEPFPNEPAGPRP